MKHYKHIVIPILLVLAIATAGDSNSSSDNKSRRIISVKAFSGKELRVIKGAIYRRAIIDIKPDLTRSVSNAIGQIRTYAHFLSYPRWELGVKKTTGYPDMLLLTLDSNNDYDEMLASQSISVFHVNPKEVKR